MAHSIDLGLRMFLKRYCCRHDACRFALLQYLELGNDLYCVGWGVKLYSVNQWPVVVWGSSCIGYVTAL